MSIGLHMTFTLCKDLVSWCQKTACGVHLPNRQRPRKTMESVDQKEDERVSNSWKERERWFRIMASFIKIVQLD